MTVKEVFDLRKQGRIEEAYDAIRPMYAAHKGRYTTLCMFWTAADVFKLRLEQGRVEEAAKILEALKRMLPRVEAINKELDTQNATTAPATNGKLSWEKTTNQQDGSAAAAFRHLSKVTQKSQKTLKDASPQGDNICDIRDICETKEEANVSEPQEELSSNSVSSSPQEDEISNSQILDRKDPRLTDLNAPQRIVLACLVAHPGYSVPQISASTGIPAKNVERHIAALIDLHLIEHRGSKKTGGYYAI